VLIELSETIIPIPSVIELKNASHIWRALFMFLIRK